MTTSQRPSGIRTSTTCSTDSWPTSRGIGVVYRAHDPDLDRVVALKLIRAGLTASDDEVHRFRTEAEAAAHLDHPNIVQVYETGTYRDFFYLCLKYVDGQSLARRTGEY